MLVGWEEGSFSIQMNRSFTEMILNWITSNKSMKKYKATDIVFTFK